MKHGYNTVCIICLLSLTLVLSPSATKPLIAQERATINQGEPDWGGELFLAEYEQRARENYALRKPQVPIRVTDPLPDWGGELFLAEYEQRARESYALTRGIEQEEE